MMTPAPGARVQVHEISAGSNFLSQDELTAHFGLGPGDAPVHRLTVRWQDGAVEAFSDVARNRLLSLSRDGGIATAGVPSSGESPCTK